MSPVERRFFSKVRMTDGCWEWIGATRLGYGRFSVDGKACCARAFLWEQVIGPVPKGHELRNACGNRACVRLGDGHVEAADVSGRRTLARAKQEERRRYQRWVRNGKTGPRPPSAGVISHEWLDSAPLLGFLEYRHRQIWTEAYYGGLARRTPDGWGFSLDRSERGRTVNENWRRTVDRQARMIVARYIAEALGIEAETVHQHIQKWRRGRRVSLYNVDRICAVFGKHISELYGSAWEDPFVEAS